MIETADPGGAALREALYAGRIFRLPARPASLALVEAAAAAVAAELGPDPRHAQFALSPADWLAAIARIRERLGAEATFRGGVRAVIDAIGWGPDEMVGDALRLRAVAHLGHEVPAAAPAYFAHRDTWYANPQAQVNVWIPLHDVEEVETFAFYRDRFTRAVANDSDGFDHDRWVREVGWQNAARPQTAVYPKACEPLDAEPADGFSARAGEIVLFSASQLHQTRPNTSGRTRFSLDFRVVHLEDHRHGRGAPNVDNRSKGSTLETYAPLAGPA